MKRCPACNREFPPESAGSHLPFCSERCRLIDLGAWLSEKHRIPQDENDYSDNSEHSDYTKH